MRNPNLLIIGANGAVGKELYDNLDVDKFGKIWLCDLYFDPEHFTNLPKNINLVYENSSKIISNKNIRSDVDIIIDLSCETSFDDINAHIFQLHNKNQLLKFLEWCKIQNRCVMLHWQDDIIKNNKVLILFEQTKLELINLYNQGNVTIRNIITPAILSKYSDPWSYGAIVNRTCEMFIEGRMVLHLYEGERNINKFVTSEIVTKEIINSMSRKSRIEESIPGIRSPIDLIISETLLQAEVKNPLLITNHKDDSYVLNPRETDLEFSIKRKIKEIVEYTFAQAYTGDEQ